MIRTFKSMPAGNNWVKPHFIYAFTHHDMLFNAYDEIGKGLCRLRTEINVKYAAMRKDQSRYVYYVELIQNLERQFSRMVVEGLHNGSVKMIRSAYICADEIREERKVA